MYIVHDKQFLFFHLRKTGGISLGKMIRLQYPNTEAIHKHTPYIWLPNEYKKYVRNYFVITWVRNPFSRFVSWWEYLNWKVKPENNKKRNRITMVQFLKQVPTFEHFVHSLQEDKSQDPLEHYYFQRTMNFSISDENGNILADYIGKKENFEEDWNRVAPKIGCENQEIWHRNTLSINGDWDLRRYYTSLKLVDIVYDYFKKDLEMFKYEVPKELY